MDGSPSRKRNMPNGQNDSLNNSQDFTGFKNISYSEENVAMVDHNTSNQSLFKETKNKGPTTTEQNGSSPLKSQIQQTRRKKRTGTTVGSYQLQPIDEEQQISRDDNGILLFTNSEASTPKDEKMTNRANQTQIGIKNASILPLGNSFKKSHT